MVATAATAAQSSNRSAASRNPSWRACGGSPLPWQQPPAEPHLYDQRIDPRGHHPHAGAEGRASSLLPSSTQEKQKPDHAKMCKLQTLRELCPERAARSPAWRPVGDPPASPSFPPIGFVSRRGDATWASERPSGGYPAPLTPSEPSLGRSAGRCRTSEASVGGFWRTAPKRGRVYPSLSCSFSQGRELA